MKSLPAADDLVRDLGLFEFDHFELGDRSTLLARFPAAAELVTRLT